MNEAALGSGCNRHSTVDLTLRCPWEHQSGNKTTGPLPSALREARLLA